MLTTKPIILAIVTACGVHSSPTARADPPAEQPDKEAPTPPLEDQHFCCTAVDSKTMTGEGCIAISGALETINACNYLLYCEGNYTKEDGKVTCE